MISIIVDANPIISALYTIEEVEKYLPYISKKSGIKVEKIREAFELLPIESYNKEFYEDKIIEARVLIENIDKKDIDILALALKTHYPLWTEDKDFENIFQINLIKTKDLI